MNKVNEILTKLGFKPHKSNWLHFAAGVLCGIFAFVFSYFELELSIIQCVGLGGAFAALAGGLILIPFTFI